MHQPKVSVVLPVYNGQEFLVEAINSILNQSFGDFEFIIINDGSKDKSADILNTMHHQNLRVFHQSNMGLAASLNKGIELSRGDFIARQDQDDVSRIDRLEKQFYFLNNNPSYGLVGSRAEIWQDNSPTNRNHDHPTDDKILRFELLFNNPFVHSSVMLRKSVIQALGGYTQDPLRQPPEDYELWSRIARVSKIANLSERLVIYREMPSSMSRTGYNPFLDKLILISQENIDHYSDYMNSSAAHNISALTHSAYDKIHGDADLHEMLNVLNMAVQNIAQGDAAVISAATERGDILKYQWKLFRSQGYRLKPLYRKIKNLFK